MHILLYRLRNEEEFDRNILIISNLNQSFYIEKNVIQKGKEFKEFISVFMHKRIVFARFLAEFLFINQSIGFIKVLIYF